MPIHKRIRLIKKLILPGNRNSIILQSTIQFLINVKSLNVTEC